MGQPLRPAVAAPVTPIGDYAAMVFALLGTTISPYMFFWQAAQEAEDNFRRPDSAFLRRNAAYAAEHLARIKVDTYVGMLFRMASRCAS